MRSQPVLFLLAGLLSGCGLLSAPEAPTPYPYASKTTYTPGPDVAAPQDVPAGYAPIFTELVARHGSRTLSSAKYADLTMQLWQQAQTEGALTPLGTLLGPELQRLIDANVKLGYGNLTALGIEEHQKLGTRLAARLPAFFAQAAVDGRHVSVLNSGKDRAVDSSLNFSAALRAAIPNLTVDAPVKNPDLLYFHKAAINQNYQDYVAGDARLNTTLSTLLNQQKSQTVAREVLLRLFSSSFVDNLQAGKYTFTFKDDGTVAKTPLDAALNLYNVYSIVPAMVREGSFNFTQFLPDTDASWLAYLTDAQDFYQKGPSFSDTTITYAMAKVLEDDFFSSLADVRSGKSTLAARLRFTHAEVVIPFAALLKLPGSDQAADPSVPYTYANNSWRGALVSPLAANIQWDAYKNTAGKVLVRMLYNETQTRFKADCQPLASGSFYYDFDELKRCYGE